MILSEIYGTQSLPVGFYAGTEYEIEDVREVLFPNNPYKIFQENDNSLRNNGFEFKTSPLTYENSLEAFNWLHKYIRIGKQAFSDRTSIHVHVNVGNLHEFEIKNLVLTYALLEPLFFQFAGRSRQDNIYCVPLNYTTLPAHYSQPIQNLINKWHKYTAFNILPIKNLGTVEFRHLGGTGDFERYKTWLTSIKSFYDATTKKGSINVLEYLAKDGDIYKLAQQTVPQLTGSRVLVESLLYDSTLDVKLASGGF